MSLERSTPRVRLDLPLVPERFPPPRSALRYRDIAAALASAQSGPADGLPGGFAPRVFAVMLRLNGQWPLAEPDVRDALMTAYADLACRMAQAALLRSDGEEPAEMTALDRYVAPQVSLYTADDTYDRAVDDLAGSRDREAAGRFVAAYRSYADRAGTHGLHELHASDALLGLAAAYTRLGEPRRALRSAAAAQLGYERWGCLGWAIQAACARVSALLGLRRWDAARSLAAEVQSRARRLGLVQLAADLRCVLLALECAAQPDPAAAGKLGALQPAYRNVSASRKAAFDHCRAAVERAAEFQRLRRVLFTLLHRWTATGTPSDVDPLRRLFAEAPALMRDIVEIPLLSLPRRGWDAVSAAVDAGLDCLHRGAVPDPAVVSDEWLSDWLRSRRAALDVLAGDLDGGALEPTRLLWPEPPEMSRAAALRVADLIGPWEHAWRADLEQLDALGAIYALAAAHVAGTRDGALPRTPTRCAVASGAHVAGTRDGALAARLVRAAANCRPDPEAFLLLWAERHGGSVPVAVLTAFLTAATPAIFPGETARRRARAVAFLRQRGLKPSAPGRRSGPTPDAKGGTGPEA